MATIPLFLGDGFYRWRTMVAMGVWTTLVVLLGTVAPAGEADPQAMVKELQTLADTLTRLEQARLDRQYGPNRFPLLRDPHPAFAYGRLTLEKAVMDFQNPRYVTLESIQAYLGNLRLAVDAARADYDPVLHASKADRDHKRRRAGSLEGAYVSPIDGSVQPFLYYVPVKWADGTADPDAGADERVPLVVMLHGYVPSYTKRRWVTMDPFVEMVMEKLGAIFLMPFGRGNTDFLSIGEVDVLAAIEEIRARYPVDDRRIYLTGYSMGGSGVWTLAAHFPDRWAAAKAWSGRNDWFHWHEDTLQAHGLTRDTFPPHKRPLVLADNPFDLVDTLRGLPLFAVHPLDDLLVQPTQSSRIAELLRPPGGRMALSQPERGSHFLVFNDWRREEAWTPLFGHRREVDPDVVEHVAYTPKYGAKHWLAITEPVDPTRAARLRVRREKTDALTTYRIEAHDNVASFWILPGRDPWNGNGLHRLYSHGFTGCGLGNALALREWSAAHRVELAPGVPGAVRVVLPTAKADAARVVLVPAAPNSEKERSLRKIAVSESRVYGLSGSFGPVKEAFNEPFALVVGTGSDGKPEPRAMANVERFFRDWYGFAHAEAPVLRDGDLIAGLEAAKDDPKALAAWNRNYVLFGTPKTNRYLARLAPELPFRFLDDGYVLAGPGGREWRETGNRLGLAAVYPNPETPPGERRCVVVLDGTYYGEKQSFNHKWDLAPDFIVFDKTVDPVDGNNQARLAACFDRDWRVDAERVWQGNGMVAPVALEALP